MQPITIADVEATMSALVALPSTSGAEDRVRDYLINHIRYEGSHATVDRCGNLIVSIPGTPGREHKVPLLYNAHMDRVPPGQACHPKVIDGIMYGDGQTNLGADDAAGMTIISLAITALAERGLPHDPLLLLFTVQEEVGLKGAQAFDPAPWGVKEGIVFDNAGEPGAVVVRGSAYIAFDAVIHGHGGHPGKDLTGTTSAIEIFRHLRLPAGIQDEGATRLNLGLVHGGTARNQIPDELVVRGEVRTLLEAEGQERWKQHIQSAFQDAAASLGGTVDIAFDPHGAAYAVDVQEPLVQLYRQAWEHRHHAFQTMSTFVGSDANALREHIQVFTVSTGAMHEHTRDECIALHPLAEMAEAAVWIACSDRG